jgi:hypothetical protein
MTRLVKEWTRSGETGRAFASRKGITAAKLYYWKLRLVGRDRGKAKPVDRFVPVRLVGSGVPSDIATTGRLEIVFESGERLRMATGVSEETLRGVIRVLRERC